MGRIRGLDDLDLFVFAQKLDAEGRHLEQFNVPNHGEILQHLTQDGAAILKYKGSNGRLRASMRRLDESTSTDAIPAHSFDRVEKLKPGEIVPVEIDMFPIGLAFRAGEQLRLVITAITSWRCDAEPFDRFRDTPESRNSGPRQPWQTHRPYRRVPGVIPTTPSEGDFVVRSE